MISKFKIITYALFALNAVLLFAFKLSITHALAATRNLRNADPATIYRSWWEGNHLEISEYAFFTMDHLAVWYILLGIVICILALDFFVFRHRLYFIMPVLLFSYYWLIFVIYQMSLVSLWRMFV